MDRVVEFAGGLAIALGFLVFFACGIFLLSVLWVVGWAIVTNAPLPDDLGYGCGCCVPPSLLVPGL